MSPEVTTGFFVLSGAFVGGLFSYMTARIAHDWDKAKSDIKRLSEQVTAYYTLEKIYKQRVADLEGSLRAPKTIQQVTRDEVQESIGFRPTMTANEAIKIKNRWS
jgi:hypothetical protein